MTKYHIEKVSLTFYFIGALFFVVIGTLIVVGFIGPAEDAAEFDRVGGAVLGWITIIFFGSIMLFALGHLLRSNAEPVICMDASGFYDRRVCSKAIPWSEIRGVRIFKGKTLYTIPQRFVSLDVIDPESYLKKSIIHSIPGHRLFRNLYDEPGITISTAILDCSPQSLVMRIKRESNGAVEVST